MINIINRMSAVSAARFTVILYVYRAISKITEQKFRRLELLLHHFRIIHIPIDFVKYLLNNK